MSGGALAEPYVVAASGMAFEARIAAAAGVRTVAGGLDSRRLADALEREVALGACGIISFGVAGGLVAALLPGTWVVGRGVVTPAGYHACDATWSAALRERLRDARFETLAGTDAPVTEPAAKRALHRASLAFAVDNESHVVAAVAAAHRLPFAAFRVVADPVDRALPVAAMAAVGTGGSVDVGAALRALMRAPAQLPSLVRTALDARTAVRELLRGRRLLGARLGFAGLRPLELDLA